ncbi:hypothetical protein NicSoilB4_16140 [Arthrobacter sp. NicSoilB4]|nr:hypothetical protein NicSoilB4_16140 [Arthrobacter sp. NicSoilB4]
MGGRVAQWVAIDQPHRVRALVLAATTGGRRQDSEQNNTAMAALLSGDFELMIPLLFDPEWANQHPDVTRTFVDSQASAWVKSRHFKASREHDAWDDLASIKAPTLILHGTDDALTPLWNGTLLHQHIRRSTLVRVPGARHGLHLDHPETANWIRQFISAKSTR